MPAEVETMVSVREVPWHRIGQVVPDVMTAKEALKAAGLNWKVTKMPLPHPALEGEMIPDKFGLVRSIDKRVLGVVGSDYVPFQNFEAFEFFDNLVASGEAKYDTAGSLREGRWIWLLAKPPEGVKIDIDEAVDFYILLSTSHDGSRSITVSVTPVRVVCMNTLNIALKAARRQWSVRHTDSAAGKLIEARTALGLTFDYIGEFETFARGLQAVKVTDARFDGLMKKLQGNLPWMADRVVEGITTLYHDSPTIAGTPAAGTGWGVLSAVGEYFDWVRPRNDESRVLGTIVGGAAARARDEVASALVSLAK